MKKSISKFKKTAALLTAIIIAASQIVLLYPLTAYGSAGETLEVRVQYYGERGDKLRTKVEFSRADLEAMGAATYHYSNVTNVGTVMVMKARGPRVTTILSEAGIDIGSVQNVTFRTTDGYTRNFNSAQISAGRYYYPKLNLYSIIEKEPEEETGNSENPTQPTTEPETPEIQPTQPVDPEPTEPSTQPATEAEPTQPVDPADTTGNILEFIGISPVYATEYEEVLNYIRSDDGRTLTPRKGSLSGAVGGVPAILALEFGSTKESGISAESLNMSRRETFRFCLGQSALKEEKRTSPGYGGGDVSSMDSAHSIYGMDVTLYGSPVKSVDLTLGDGNVKVGSKIRVNAKIVGDELYSDYLDIGTLNWESSDKELATVDNNGIVTIKKEGTVTITATAKDGTQGSITIGEDGKATASVVENEKQGKSDKKESDKPVEIKDTLLVREISIGEKVEDNIKDEQINTVAQGASKQTSALDEGEQYSKITAGVTAALAIAAGGAGAAIRVRRFNLSR